MRLAPILLAALLLPVLAAPPARAADECQSPCTPLDAGGATYYVVPSNADCATSPQRAACTGSHPLPLVYRENGSCPGLQTTHSIRCLADDVVAV